MKHLVVSFGLAALCTVSFAQEVAPEKEVDDKAAAREEWFYSQRAYPMGRIPDGARMKAIAEIRRIDQASRAQKPFSPRAASPATTLSATNWTSIGPQPTGGGTTYVTSGRVNAIAIDPRDTNTVYIGAAEGGVWKTNDGGANWTPLTDAQSSLASGAIAIDPNNPDTVYVGTGEENFAQDSYYGAGILKSTDAGNSWTNLVGPFLHATIGRIAISPKDSQTLLCSSSLGVYRSTDGANTWTRVLTGVGTGVVYDPTNGNLAYAALGAPGGASVNGFFRSTDGGLTWSLSNGTGANALPSVNVGRIEIAISPATPTTLFVGISDSSNAAFGDLLGIFKSTDSGATWSKLQTPDMCSAPNQCWYDMTIRVSPADPNLIFAGGSATNSIIRSTDGGTVWNQVPLTGPNGVQMHVDEHYLAFTNDGTKLYVANDGGVYSATGINSGSVSWTELNDTLAITQFYPGLSIHPSNPNITFGGAQDNGTQRYGGGPSWTNVTCGDGGFTAVDSALSSVAYAACQDVQILRSTNTGNGWSTSQYGIPTGDRVQFIAPLTIDQSNPLHVYFGTYRVYQSIDGAGKWTPISPDLSAGKSTLKAIAVAPSDSNTIYAGNANGVFASTNDAQNGPNSTWTDHSSGLPARAITSITVDPIDPATVYVTFSGFSNTAAGKPGAHIFKSTDGGSSWSDIGPKVDIPADTLAIDPDIPGTLYAGLDSGVMVTTDGGSSWNTLGSGLPTVVVEALVLHRQSRILRAATHGRSMWDILVPLPASSQQPVIASISPSTANAGSAGFTVAVAGSNFSTGTVARWNGSVRPTSIVDSTHLVASLSASDVAVVGRFSVDVFNPSPGIGASNAALLTLGPAPVSSSAAFVNAANPAGGSVIAPRSIASLYGVNLSGFTELADAAPPLPFNLGGTTMTLAGSSVPFFFVSPGQINFQVPFVAVNGPTQALLTITQGTFSTAITVTLTPYSPALFTTNSQGTGQASALIANTSTIVAPVGAFPGSRPAKAGEFVSLFATGLGDVTSPRPAIGAATPATPLKSTLVTTTATLGNVPAPVSFSGLAPGFVSLYQVNIQIPANAPTGSAVPVFITIGGVNSNTATIAVQ